MFLRAIHSTIRKFCVVLMLVPFLVACYETKPVQTLSLASQGIYSAAFDQSGEQIVIGSYQHGGSLWRTDPLDRLHNWNHKNGEYSVLPSVSLDSQTRYAATASQKDLVIWNASTGEPKGFWQTSGAINSISFSSDGNQVLLAQQDDQATLLDVISGKVIYQVFHDDAVLDSAISAEGDLAATGSEDNMIRIWELHSGKTRMQIPQTAAVWTVELDYRGERLFASGNRQEGRIFQTETGQLIESFPAPSGYYSAARFSSNGDRLLLGTTDGHIYLWRLNPKEQLGHWQPGSSTWLERRGRIIDVAFASRSLLAIDASGKLYQLK